MGVTEKIRVLIVDDSDFVRDGMKIILSIDERFEVTGCAANGEEAIKLAKEHPTDVVLMDIQMPGMDGIKATKRIVEENLGKVLILTTFEESELVEQALNNGASGYLIKNHTPEQLKNMILSIHSGIHVMDETVFQKFYNKGIKPATRFDSSKYTARELEIVEAVAEGYSNREIAEKLFLGEGTVKNYISTILEKEGLSHRTQLAVYYLTGNKA
jgi:DNA-binding NarL/FixJ family response regulator